MYTTAGSPRPIVKPTTDRKKLVDAITLITPDSGSGQFFDALLEASERVDKDKTPSHNIIVIIGSDSGSMRLLDRDFLKLQQNVLNHGIDTRADEPQNQGAGGWVDLGLNITGFTGSKYSFNGTTRLATARRGYGDRREERRSKSEYRVTYQRPAKPNERRRHWRAGQQRGRRQAVVAREPGSLGHG